MEEEIDALDILTAMLNSLSHLFHSRSLYLPYHACGVFGGQVISQGLVTAIKLVKPELALHVSLVHWLC